MTRPRRPRLLRQAAVAAALGLVAPVTVTAVVPLGAAATTSAVGQDRSTDGVRWRIESVSPWVEPDGEFEVRFAPSTEVDPESVLTVSIHQAVSGASPTEVRETVQEVIEGETLPDLLQEPLSVPLGLLGDPAEGSVVTLPVRAGSGDEDRVLLPNPGVHPVEVLLEDPDGAELARDVVFLNRLPDTDTDTDTGAEAGAGAGTRSGPGPVDVSLMLPVESPAAVDPDGTASFDVEEESSLGAIASLLEEVPDAPLTLGVRPNTLDGLARSDERWAADLLATLSDDGSAAILQAPYAALDTGALVAAGHGFEIARQVVVGAGTVIDRLDRVPTTGTWAFDGTVTTEALPVIADTGVRRLLVPSGSLQVDDPESRTEVMTRPLPLAGGAGVSVLAYDSTVSQLLADATTEPAQRVHQAVSLLLVAWFAEATAAEPGSLASAVLVDPNVEPTVVAGLTEVLSGGGPLRADPTGPPAPPADSPLVGLAPRTTPEVGPAVEESNETRRLLSAYRSMVGDVDPDIALWDELNDESLSASLDDGARAALQSAVRVGLDGRIRAVEPPAERRVVVTSQDSVIPLRFRNDLPFDVRLRLEARSSRLDLGGAESTEIVLAPGENRVDLDVSVQAPGESLLRIRLSSPDEGIELPGSEVPVRSTAISGVGAALSVLSLLFLVVWWFRTHRRSRRETARSNGTHPSTDEPADRLVTGG